MTPTGHRPPRTRRRGFTLVEIVVVLVVVGVLSLIAFAAYKTFISRGKTTTMTAAAAQMGKVLQAESARAQTILTVPTPAGPSSVGTVAAPGSVVGSIQVGGQALSPDAQKDLVTAAGANATMQTASYGLLVSNPNWPNDGSCTLIFSSKVGGAPSTSCGTVVSAGGNLLTTDEACLGSGVGSWAAVAPDALTWDPAGVERPACTGSVVLTKTGSAGAMSALIPALHSRPGLGAPAGKTVTGYVWVYSTAATNVTLWTQTNVTNNAFVNAAPVAANTWTLLQGTYTYQVGETTANLRVVTGSVPVGTQLRLGEAGFWQGSGGQWAPPGQPIYQ